MNRLFHTACLIYSKNHNINQILSAATRDKFDIKVVRSSGPGGQNVNKLNTKAEVRFHVPSANWLPEETRTILLEKKANHINKTGELIVTSELTRSQHRNIDDAIGKIKDMLREVSHVPEGPTAEKTRRVQQHVEAADKKRLVEKKFRSLKKQERKNID